jgi:hypothetical protein
MRAFSHSRRRRSRISSIVAVSVLIALLSAIVAVAKVHLLPPRLEPRGLETASATTHLLIDLPKSRIADRQATWDYFTTTRTAATMVARLMATAPALEHIGHHAGIAPDRIAAVAPVTANVQTALTEPGSEQRAAEILRARSRYRLEAHARRDVPIIDVYTLAPSPAAAAQLADAAALGMRDYLSALAVREGSDPRAQVRIQQLGPARGGVTNPVAKPQIAALTFVVAFALSCLALLSLAWARDRRLRAPVANRAPPATPALTGRGATVTAFVEPRGPRAALPVAAPGGAAALGHPAFRPAVAMRAMATHGGDWPRTTRVLPWMLAVFMAILWLVPFDSIELNASLPVDLKFDRLVLPFVLVTWALALIAGGRGAPRVRVTGIHLAVGAFVAVAFLSVVLGAQSLNQSLELDTAVKKLQLLLSYLSLFVVLASVVRRAEVRPFLIYMLVLAVICALGVLWEYRTQYNMFFDLPAKLLPGVFKIATLGSGYDLSGRRTTHGPAAHGLVVVAMFAMALPIAVVGIMHAKRWRSRVLYSLAAGLLMLAMLSTQRKTALVAPASAFLVLAYFRRRELLKLTPAAVVALVALLIVSPGTLAPVAQQFRAQQLGGANTVNDRASDYDAIRPDVFSHIAIGRGYGTYQPVGHRILDSEVLVRLVETGVLGLAAFVFLGLAAAVTGRATIAARHPTRAPPALIGAAAGIVFLVTATLFDVMSFPQVPYIFLVFAALAAAVVKPADED